MMIRIKLKSYLQELDGAPSLLELSRRLGMDADMLYKIANNKIKQLSLETGGRIISELRGMGYDMQISDLLEIVDKRAIIQSSP